MAQTDRTGMDDDDRDALAGEYVLGTLDPAERSAAEARMAADPHFRAAVAAWEKRLQPLGETAVPVAPHDSVWQRIEARLDAPVAAQVQPATTLSRFAVRSPAGACRRPPSPPPRRR